MSKQKKSIEETYKKVNQREHVLLRPNMYIGSTKKEIQEVWVMESNKMKKKMIEFSPGFLKIFDEVLTNALDHSNRDTTLDKIEVRYDEESGEISVYNTGSGIPVVIHKDHNTYVPELVFGNLLSSSNYNDEEKRTGAGVNGLGIKLLNLYSKVFKIETVDSENGLKYTQVFKENMSVKEKPKITKNSSKSYTKVTFLPDYNRFSMKGLEKDTIKLLEKRVYDCIACTNPKVSIYLNGKKIIGKGLQDYIKYFFDESQEDSPKIYHESSIKKINGIEFIWEWAVVPWDKFEQVSFVNGNSTYNGGKHVDHILYQITNSLKSMLETKKRLKDIKPSIIKDKIFLFLRATVINPQFSSQTKETLTTQSRDFGCKVEVSEKFIDKLWKSKIVEELVEFCKLKETLSLSKQDGSKRTKVVVPKLEDAIWAGTNRSNQCTLILTEGDSAKTFAMWGRSVVGNEKYGIYPLRGKCCSEDTKIPLWNGEIKLAKDIKIGETLIGDDGNPRTVLTLYKNRGKMYEVSQERGESYKVNDEHILSLCFPEHKQITWVPRNYLWIASYWDSQEQQIKIKRIRARIKVKCKECDTTINISSIKRHYARKHKTKRYIDTSYRLSRKYNNKPEITTARKKLQEFLSTIGDNNIIDISIGDYLNLPESLKKKLKGIRGKCVNWQDKNVLLEPYLLGCWLGDESEYYREKISESSKKILVKYDLINNRHIPRQYIVNSEATRLKVLAGIIRTSGYIYKNNTVEIFQLAENKKLVDDIIYLSRSLGFYTSLSEKTSGQQLRLYTIKIRGKTYKISNYLSYMSSINNINKHDIDNSTGTIRVRETRDENYVGIGITGNNRFVINDFTVTHNCLNVRDATTQQLLNNTEINNLKKILGLKQNKEYKDVSELRYGKIMILTDADEDGSHIKGLLINMFHYWWPNLLKLNYIQTLKTPIVKAFKRNTVKEFFTKQDYINWKEEDASSSSYQIKYYKGLGTSKKEDAKDSFTRLNELKTDYYYRDSDCDKAILLAFEKDKNVKNTKSNTELEKYSDKRKRWLGEYNRSSYVDAKNNRISFGEFINKDLIHFSIYDNTRSIPSLCDGLKPSQRKILYYMLNKNIEKEIKVAQLSGYVSAETSYHHGEASLQQAIITMAQDFVGSNNINLLTPSGNFGSRWGSGKDAASPRYIFTKLSQITKMIFHPDDNPLLNYLDDDGQQVEPEWFVPIIPMVLVNGAEGIGTGYSTYIPPYNPKEIIKNIKRVLNEEEQHELVPYFRGFNGEVEKISENSYITKGRWSRKSPTILHITEIPVGVSINAYKEYLESHIETTNTSKSKDERSKSKSDSLGIKEVINMTKDENNDICFEVEFKSKAKLDKLIESENLEKELKLQKTFGTNNMYVFDDNLTPAKYINPRDLLLDFCDIRLDFYHKRKKHITRVLLKQLELLENRIRFINEYISGDLEFNRRSKDFIEKVLQEREYKPMTNDNSATANYDYLIKLPLYSLTKEKIEELEKQIQDKKQKLDDLRRKTAEQIWIDDLDKLQQYLEKNNF